MKTSYIGTRLENIIFNFMNTVLMVFLVIITIYPFINTIAVSFNEGLDSLRGGIYIVPRSFTLHNYQALFSNVTIYNAFMVSVLRTILSTVLNIFLTTMLAYTLSRKEFIFRKFITVVLVLTMYFNAGLIPTYFLYRGLGLVNNFLVYVVPSLIGVFNLIVVRTYIGTLPESFIESARIDGAGDFTVFMRIIFPLCKPVLATVAIFVAVGAWNSWFDSFIYCSSKQALSTLQYELMKLMSIANIGNSNSALLSNAMSGGGSAAQSFITPVSLRAAVTVIVSAPIIFIYPFLQKYFIVGLTVGGVKE